MKRNALIAFLPLLIAGGISTAAAEPAAATPAVPAKRAFTLEDLKAQIPQNKEGRFLMELSDILNTATDLEAQAVLAGQPVETTGQVMPELLDNADGRRLRIFRAQLLCCSAHARQCSVALELPAKAPALKEQAWIKVIGTLSYRREGRSMVPVLVVADLKETAVPESPLLK